jgi:hypothetical protein
MSEMSWWEAILAVLKDSAEAMHYTDISDEIIKRGLRSSVGATPASTVNALISVSLASQGTESPFERTARGIYRLRAAGTLSSTGLGQTPPAQANPPAELSAEIAAEAAKETTGLINALGMYWSRDKINWVPGSPKLLGRQNAGSQAVDLSDQRGVYLLYDRSEVIYVGRAIDQGIGTRLKQHTFDRLSGRWERFSWFGVHRVSENGTLDMAEPTYDRTLLIATMEALLIESVEPSQNRKRGDEFRAVEFLQAEDPEVEIIRKRAIIAELAAKL